jgi:hypothetical protein
VDLNELNLDQLMVCNMALVGNCPYPESDDDRPCVLFWSMKMECHLKKNPLTVLQNWHDGSPACGGRLIPYDE